MATGRKMNSPSTTMIITSALKRVTSLTVCRRSSGSYRGADVGVDETPE